MPNLTLLTLGFWFNPMAVPFMPWLERALPIALAFIGLAGLVAMIFARYGKGIEKDVRKMWMRIGSAAVSAGVLGGIMFFFHWQRVPYLTMRVYWLLWLVGFGYWAYLIWKDHFKKLPQQRAQERERAAYEKWLPKPKK